MRAQPGQTSESFLLAGILAVSGGFLDAYTYILRGGVFANAQTGNLVFIALYAVEGQIHQALLQTLPVLAFVAGIWLTNAVRHAFFARNDIHWRQIVAAAEGLLLFMVGFIPQGPLDFAVNIVVSLVCAMQVQGFSKVRGTPYASTMCTGNLRSATHLLYQAHHSGDRTALRNSLQYYAIILLFLAGVALGSCSVRRLGVRAVFVCCALLLLCFLLMFRPQTPQK